MEEDSEPTVVIIGAGFSGLSAADTIVRNSRSKVIVLEAMDRVGGRALTKTISGARFDFGPTWVSPHHRRVMHLAQRAQLKTVGFPSNGFKIVELGPGRVAKTTNSSTKHMNFLAHYQTEFYVNKLNQMSRQVPVQAPSQCRHAQLWDSVTVFSWLKDNVWFEHVKHMLDKLVRSVFGVESGQISMLYFLWTIHQNGSLDNLIHMKIGGQNSQVKFQQGIGSMCEYLAEEFTKLGGSIILNCPVEKVTTWKNGKYLISTKNEQRKQIEADYIVIAIPPTCVNRITFKPALSSSRNMICQKSSMGSSVKAVLLYEKPFWLEHRFSEESVFQQFEGPVLNAYDDSRVNDKEELQPALTVYLTSTMARYWGDRKDLKHHITHQVREYLGETCPDPTQVHIEYWNENQFLRGGPMSNFGPGLLHQVSSLEERTGNIFWAGTELATECQGYVEGAIQSGQRAAEELLNQINNLKMYPVIPDIPDIPDKQEPIRTEESNQN